MTEIPNSDFLHWVQKIVEPLGGDTAEAGYAHAGIDLPDIVMPGANANRRLRAI